MKKKILITGASGYIGRHILDALDENEWEIYACSKHNKLDNKNVDFWHLRDLLNPLDVKTIIYDLKPDYIIHAAWEVGEKYTTSPNNFDWVQSGINLAKIFAECNGERFIFVGTSFEYDITHGIMKENVTPLNPNTVYGVCKHAMDILFTKFFERESISYANARVFHSYGKYEASYRLIPKLIATLKSNKIFSVNQEELIADYSNVKDIGKAIVVLTKSLGVNGPVNIASGRPTEVYDIIRTIATMMGKNDLVKFDATATKKYLIANTNRLKYELEFEIPDSIQSDLCKLIDYYK
jgi:nucleoside-diphosphate-sugar epimerase